MPNTTIEVEGLQELINKLDEIPKEVELAMQKTMQVSLLTLQNNTAEMGYPPQRANMVRPYKRTNVLAKSLGMTGGKPTVYSIKGSGVSLEGRYGTDLSYAKYVIGDNTQAYMHQGWWWTMNVVKERAKEKIVSLWNTTITKIKTKLGL